MYSIAAAASQDEEKSFWLFPGGWKNEGGVPQILCNKAAYISENCLWWKCKTDLGFGYIFVWDIYGSKGTILQGLGGTWL